MLNYAHLTIRCTGHEDLDEFIQDNHKLRIVFSFYPRLCNTNEWQVPRFGKGESTRSNVTFPVDSADKSEENGRARFTIIAKLSKLKLHHLQNPSSRYPRIAGMLAHKQVETRERSS